MTQARILKPTAENLATLGRALKERGELVGMPTETVYGLAANAFDEAALSKVFAAKERPTFDPLIVHVSPTMAQPDALQALAGLGLVALQRMSHASRLQAARLMKAFWPGPLTLVLPKTARVPDLATSGLATVGLRMPRHPDAQALIDAAGVPLAAPSANRFGRISPTSAEDVASELGDRIPFILDGGPCEVGLESTVVSVSAEGLVTILRPGGVTQAELERELGAEVAVAGKPYAETAGLSAPGMLESHYAPSKTIELLPAPLWQLGEPALKILGARHREVTRVGLLLLSGDPREAARKVAEATGFRVTEALSLSLTGDLSEAARNLFHHLRELDAGAAQLLLAEPCEIKTGLGHAIGDRLSRAAHPRTA